MKSIKFGNKSVLQIVSNSIKNEIKSSVRSITNMDITSRYYSFLNEKNLHNLNDTNFKVCVNTFGHKYLLFLTKYNNKNYCIFINKKKEDMIHIRFRFSEELFSNTLFDGELIKNNENDYVYSITDIIAFKNKFVLNDNTLDERIKMMDHIVNNNYVENDIMNFCLLDVKKYFELKYLEDIYKRYIPSIPYKCSGIFLQHIINYKNSYMYIFPEFRTLSQTQTQLTSSNNDKNHSLNNNKNNNNKNKNNDRNKIENDEPDKSKPYNFQIRQTDLPDIYKLYYPSSDNKLKFIGYAGIPNMETSKLLTTVFDKMGDKDDVRVCVKCEHSENFDKWIPKELVN